jgi:hypothetical protein
MWFRTSDHLLRINQVIINRIPWPGGGYLAHPAPPGPADHVGAATVLKSHTAASAAASASIGGLTDREFLIAGAIAYWCEGAKSKPRRPSDRVAFTNSDPDLIRFFLHFLDATGTARTSLSFRIRIHESADLEAAQRFWLEITAATTDQFLAPTLKHHNPKTVRKNVGEDYHGCLSIDVYRSAELYRKIEGWAGASMAVRRAVNRIEADEPPVPRKPSDAAARSGPVSWNRAQGNVP